MTPPSTAEVMEALRRWQALWHRALAHEPKPSSSAREVLHKDLAAMALLEKYAPEMVARAEEEARGERRVRPVLTVEEARALPWPATGEAEAFKRACDKLDFALRDLEDPPSRVEAMREEDSE